MSSEPILPRFIMIYGRDASLMETRGWVLEKSGCGVCRVESQDALERIVSTRPISLVVLCYTLSAEDRTAALGALEAIAPTAKKLILTISRTEIPSSGSFQTFSASEGPRALLALVKEMLEP